MVRRYAVANRLDVLWTLTYSDQHLPADLRALWRDVEDFRRRLRELVGDGVPIVCVPERGTENGRLHVHFLARRHALRQEQVAEAWRGRGWVSLRYEQSQRRKGEGRRARARRMAGYLSAYLTPDGSEGVKTALEDRAFNGRRYSVSKGFQPSAVRARGREAADLLRWLADRCGGPVEWSWRSSDDPDWPGPPVESYRFGDP